MASPLAFRSTLYERDPSHNRRGGDRAKGLQYGNRLEVQKSSNDDYNYPRSPNGDDDSEQQVPRRSSIENNAHKTSYIFGLLYLGYASKNFSPQTSYLILSFII